MSRGRAVAGTVLTAGLAAAAARAVYAGLARRPPGGAATWTRVNHRGEPVSLLAGSPRWLTRVHVAVPPGGRRDSAA